jgi:multiple sugar transport system substrate-binding protein
MLYYNKELFAQKGVEYPKSMADIVTAAAKLNDPSKGVAGFVSRGLKNANIPVWTSWLLGQGLETIDPVTGKLNTDGAEAIWAAELSSRATSVRVRLYSGCSQIASNSCDPSAS